MDIIYDTDQHKQLNVIFLSSVLQILKPIKMCIAASNRKSNEGLKNKENLLLWADIRFIALNVILS